MNNNTLFQSGGDNNSVTFYPEDLEMENVDDFSLNCVAVNDAAELKVSKTVTLGSEFCHQNKTVNVFL